MKKTVKKKELDTRTSDAIALAVRFKCPIYTYEFILAQSGIILEGEGKILAEPDVPEKPKKPKRKEVRL